MSVVPDSFRAYGEESLSQAPAFGPGKDGIFEATLVRQAGGETRLVGEYTKVPYHLTGTLDSDPAPGLTTLCLQEPTGGVAQGDRHSIDVTARERARAHVTTQSATKVHSMRENYAHLDATLEAGPDAHLEYVPGPTIVNEDARCLQTVTVDLAETASVVVADVLVPDGLSAHDAFGFDHYHSRLEARCDDRLVCADAVDLRPDERDPRDPATVGEYGVVGTVYVLAPDEDTDALSTAIHERLADHEAVRAGVSGLAYGAGVSVRLLGNRSADVTAAVTAAWDETRREILGVGAPADRRY
ncbi:urease accessory protein UreD [Natrialbaceae archaeon A-gly3]